MMSSDANIRADSPASRRMGRRSTEESRGTRRALLQAAAAAFAEHGFKGATLANVAERADVTTGAIYRHFASKEDLLVEASRSALGSLRLPAPADDRPIALASFAAGAARRFLAPGEEQSRRLFIELHLAATRSPRIAELLAEWHREILEGWRDHVPAEAGSPEAVTKMLFLLLLGLNHLEGVAAIDTDQSEIESIGVRLATALVLESPE